MRNLSPYEISERLKEQYNCKIKQKPRGRYLSFEVDVKSKINMRKILGIFPVTEYYIEKKKIYFDTGYSLGTRNLYGRMVQESYIEVALDLENEVVYWRYGNN